MGSAPSKGEFRLSQKITDLIRIAGESDASEQSEVGFFNIPDE